jgi:hypothetical protein
VFRHLSLTLVNVVKAINDILIGREFVMVRIVPLVQATVPLFIGEFFVHLKGVFVPLADVIGWDLDFNSVSDNLGEFEVLEVVVHGNGSSFDIIRSPSEEHVWLEGVLLVRVLGYQSW